MNASIPYHPFQSANIVALVHEGRRLEPKELHRRFAERLGEMIDLADSFILADQLKAIARLSSVRSTDKPSRLLAQLYQLNLNLITRLDENISRFDLVIEQNDASAQLAAKLSGEPRGTVPVGSAKDAQTQQLRRFYITLQRDLKVYLGKSRALVRALLSAESPEMTQLAKLDESLGDVLDGPLEKALNRLPAVLTAKVLSSRTITEGSAESKPNDGLVNSSETAGSGGKTISGEDCGNCDIVMARQTIRSFIFAEYELRFMPVMGMLEAFQQTLVKEESIFD